MIMNLKDKELVIGNIIKLKNIKNQLIKREIYKELER